MRRSWVGKSGRSTFAAPAAGLLLTLKSLSQLFSLEFGLSCCVPTLHTAKSKSRRVRPEDKKATVTTKVTCADSFSLKDPPFTCVCLIILSSSFLSSLPSPMETDSYWLPSAIHCTTKLHRTSCKSTATLSTHRSSSLRCSTSPAPSSVVLRPFHYSKSSKSNYYYYYNKSQLTMSSCVMILWQCLLVILLLAPLTNAQYKPQWPDPMLAREIFVLNLEDGYFGCQVNDSADFLQLFELSKLCDGAPQCFRGSDELSVQLKCTDRSKYHGVVL